MIAQQTRHQTESTLVPMRRKFLVTTVWIPGVCESCHHGLQRKRLLASVLAPLPLIALLGFVVVVDTPVAGLPMLLYLFYVLPRVDYTWTDFLLYGRDLSWKLTDYVPEKDREVLARYPVDIVHIILRIGLLPALAVGLFAVVQVIPKSHPAATTARDATVPQPATPQSAPVTSLAPAPVAPLPEHVQRALLFFNTSGPIAVPINEATRATPRLAQPATSITLVDGGQLNVVKAYAEETNIPPGTAYQLMTAATLLIQCSAVSYQGLVVEDRKLFLPPREVSLLVTKTSVATGRPSAVKVAPSR
jgi:hypothetical protein